MTDLPASTLRVAQAAAELGLQLAIRLMPASTRTAAEAAEACGTTPAQIVKSLIFVGATTDTPYLFLVSGKNRVDEHGVSETLGEGIRRPDAQRVREVTGYAIGGIPPLGHTMQLRTYMDADLLAYEEVWAAAGHPNTVFPIDPAVLRDAVGAVVTRIG